MSPVHQFLSGTATRILPRILTQVCRDPDAPCFGSCDRNWWHYKIRDFPSIILQQAGYALALASNLRQQPTANRQPSSPALRQLAAASARFWNQRAIRHGAFEEYYPCEQGYPPAAFSTLAVAKLCHDGLLPLAEIRAGLVIAAHQLLTRFEAQAANQQIAGTAALSVIRSLDPSLVDEPRFQRILGKTLALQHAEGWFPEYDGPDLGYLSVSIDCLWDIFDHTGDTRARSAIASAADYIEWFALSPLGGAGMHNSRNTDYLVPYGLVRLALEEPGNPARSALVSALFSPEPGTFHPFDAVDDRYWCHYIGHSVFRALGLLETQGPANRQPPTADRQPPTANHQPPTADCQPGSGHVLLRGGSGATALVSARKGAIVSAIWPDGQTAHDFGWIIRTPSREFVSHWWSTDWKIALETTHASCEGNLVPHKEHLSSPLKHFILRGGSFFLGRRLIPLLKRLVIFKKNGNSLRFSRQVRWENTTLVIRDEIEGLRPEDKIARAPRTSKRHVASADSYHPQDLLLLKGVTRTETITRNDGTFICETRFRMAVGSERLAVVALDENAC